MTFRSRYQIVFTNPSTGNIIRVLPDASTFKLRYSRKLNDVGKFTVVLSNRDTDWFGTLPLDTIVDIQRTDPVTKELAVDSSFFVRNLERFQSGADDRTAISGVHLNNLLDRRIIDPDDDPQAAGGYSTKTGLAGDVIREYVREQAGDLSSRPFPNFTVPNPSGSGKQVGADLRYENLLDEVKKLAKRGEVEFDIQHTTGNRTEMIIGKIGTDRSVKTNVLPPYTVFDPNRGNIESPRLKSNRRDEQSFVYALGEGEGVNRDVLKIPGDFVADSPFNRIEFKEDARNGSKGDTLNLLTAGVSALLDNRPDVELSFDVIQGSIGAVYNLNWFLGDIVTVKWDGFQRQLQITEIDIRVDNNDERINPKVRYL